MAENFVTQKLGPLPMWAWVGVGSLGVVAIMYFSKSNSGSSAQNNQTNAVSALAPTEAEAFGTIEQQQQDVTNALTTLGNNQAAMGGSLSTLAGSETSNWANANTQFGSILQAISGVSGQVTNVGSQVSGVSGQVSGVSGQVSGLSAADQQYYANLANQLNNQYNALSSQVQAGNAAAAAQQNQLQQMISNIGTFLGWQFYQIPNRYSPMIPLSLAGQQGGTNVATGA